MKSSIELGYEEGTLCNRPLVGIDGQPYNCEGIIKRHPIKCYCDVTPPPCDECTTPHEYCEDCDWDAASEEKQARWEELSKRLWPKKAIVEVLY